MFKKKKKKAVRKARAAGEAESTEAEESSAPAHEAKVGEFVLYELRDGRNKGGVRPALVLGEEKPKEYGDPTPDQIAAERTLMAQEDARGETPEAPEAEKGEAPKTPDQIAADRVRTKLEQRQDDAPQRMQLIVFLVPTEDFGGAINRITGYEGENFMWTAAEAGEPGDGGVWFPLGTEIPEKEDEGKPGFDKYGRRVNEAGEFERYPGEGNREVIKNPAGTSGGGAAP